MSARDPEARRRDSRSYPLTSEFPAKDGGPRLGLGGLEGPWPPEAKERVLECYRETSGRLLLATRAGGVPYETVKTWMRRDESFRTRMKAIKEECTGERAEQLEEAIMNAAIHGGTRRRYDKLGNVVGEEDFVYQTLAIAAAAQHLGWTTSRKQVDVEVTEIRLLDRQGQEVDIGSVVAAARGLRPVRPDGTLLEGDEGSGDAEPEGPGEGDGAAAEAQTTR